MTRLARSTSLCILAGLLSGTISAAEPYVLGHDLAIGGEGRWDYVTCNADGTLIYVTRSDHTQVIETATGKVVADIPKTEHSHGVALDPISGRGFISNGSTVTIFDLKTYHTLGSVAAADDADGIISDPFSKHALVFCGDAKVMVPIPFAVDPATQKADPAVDLGGEPEFAAADGKGHVYVNIKDTSEVVAINTQTMKVEHRYPLAPGANPTGMAMDPQTGRLFIGCRNQVLVIMKCDDGTIVSHFPIGTGVDATAFFHGLVFASCGDGTLSIVHEDSPDAFSLVQTLSTEHGARTMAINPVNGAIYLPTSDFTATPATDTNPHPRPAMTPGTFRLVVANVAPPGK
jgi:hypothetical protein